MKPARYFLFAMLLFSTSLLSVNGCGSVQRPRPLMAQVEDLEATEAEFRVRIGDFTEQFVGTIEGAADRIARETGDPEIRRRAILWKLNAVTVYQSALIQPDPLGSFLEAWTFCAQMTDYFTDGHGREQFGELQSIAIAASNELEVAIAAHASALARGEPTRGRQMVYAWADEHPIDNDAFVRDSIAQLTAQIVADQGGESALATLGRITTGVEDMTAYLAVYTATLPKVIRWQAELVLDDALRRDDLGRALEDVHAMRTRVDELFLLIDSFPEALADEQMVAVLSALDAALDYERDEILALIDDQWGSMVGDLDLQRLAIEGEIDRQRLATLQEVNRQIEEVMARVDSLAAITVDDSTASIERLLDEVYTRALRLVILTLVGVLAIILVARFMPQVGRRASSS